MESNRIFEIGSVIISTENNFDKIDKTLKSIKSQNEIARKIVILSLSKKAIKESDKKWINEKTTEFKELGTQDFKFVDIIDENATTKDAMNHVFKQIIFKPMAIRIHSPNGFKKGKISLTHFSTITAGCEYETKKYFEYTKKIFETDKKAFVLYSNYTDKKVNFSELKDTDAITYHVFGYNFFVASNTTEKNIIDCYKIVRKERIEAKKIDMSINTLDENSYKDIIFSKSQERAIFG